MVALVLALVLALAWSSRGGSKQPWRRLADNGDMNFRRLDVYRLSMEHLALVTNTILPKIPKGHAHIRDQLRRAAMSIPLNIAESSGKTTRADQRRFFAIARGSAMECAAIIDVYRVLKVGEPSALEKADVLLQSIVRMLSKLAR